MEAVQTQLQKALAQHARTVAPSLRRPHTRASFLFDGRQASEIDLDMIYNIGVNGLEELRKFDFHFAPFAKTLFGSAGRQGVERALLTAEENQLVDESVVQFLRVLSPFFLLKPAHKTLEFLIRRYRIHEYNVDAVLECILPFHETALFARMVQLLAIGPRSQWKALKTCQEAGTRLDRQSLVTMCTSNSSVLTFICEIPRHSIESGMLSKTVASFYGSVMCEYLRALPSIDTKTMTRVLPHIIYGIEAVSQAVYQATSYLILNQLVVRVTLSDELAPALLASLCKYLSDGLLREGLLTVMVVCQTQRLTEFPDVAFKYLVKNQGLIVTIQALSGEYDMSLLVSLLLRKLVAFSLRHVNYSMLLKDAVMTWPLNKALASQLVSLLLSRCVECRAESAEGESADSQAKVGEGDSVFSALVEILRHLAVMFPDSVDKGITQSLTAGEENKGEMVDKKQFQETISSIFCGTLHGLLASTVRQSSASETVTLGVALRHPRSEMRRLAFAQLPALLSSSTQDPCLPTMVLEGLQSGDFSVIHEILKAPTLLAALPGRPLGATLRQTVRTVMDAVTVTKSQLVVASRAVQLLADLCRRMPVEAEDSGQSEQRMFFDLLLALLIMPADRQRLTHLAIRLGADLAAECAVTGRAESVYQPFFLFVHLGPLAKALRKRRKGKRKANEETNESFVLTAAAAVVLAVAKSLVEDWDGQHHCLRACVDAAVDGGSLSHSVLPLLMLVLHSAVKCLALDDNHEREKEDEEEEKRIHYILRMSAVLAHLCMKMWKQCAHRGVPVEEEGHATEPQGPKERIDGMPDVDWALLPSPASLVTRCIVAGRTRDSRDAAQTLLVLSCWNVVCECVPLPSLAALSYCGCRNAVCLGRDEAMMQIWGEEQEVMGRDEEAVSILSALFAAVAAAQGRDFHVLWPALQTLLRRLGLGLVLFVRGWWLRGEDLGKISGSPNLSEGSGSHVATIIRALGVFEAWVTALQGRLKDNHVKKGHTGKMAGTDVENVAFQDLLPSLMVALQHPHIDVRQASLAAITQLHAVGSATNSSVARDIVEQCSWSTLYPDCGSARCPAPLSQAGMLEICEQLMERREEMIHDPTVLFHWVPTLLSQPATRQSLKELQLGLPVWLLSHAQVLQTDYSRLLLVRMLQGIPPTVPFCSGVARLLQDVMKEAQERNGHGPSSPDSASPSVFSNSSKVVQDLLLLMMSLLFRPSTIAVMGWDQTGGCSQGVRKKVEQERSNVFEVLLQALQSPLPLVHRAAVRVAAGGGSRKQKGCEFIRGLSHDRRDQLLRCVVQLRRKEKELARGGEENIRRWTAKILHVFPLHPVDLAHWLEKLSELAVVHEAEGDSEKGGQGEAEEKDDEGSVAAKTDLLLFLELLNHRGTELQEGAEEVEEKGEGGGIAVLVLMLFRLLRGLMSGHLVGDGDGTESEYALQLVLGVLSVIVEAGHVERAEDDGTRARHSGWKKKTTRKGDWEQFVDADLLLSSMRDSHNPQTHTHALRLLSSLSLSCPHCVLSSLERVVKCLGETALRQGDEDSFAVVGKVMATAGPPLVAHVGVSRVAELFLSQVGETVPFRRIEYLKNVVAVLGKEEGLGTVILALLLLSHHENRMKDFLVTGERREEKGDQEDDLDVCQLSLGLFKAFPASVQLQAVSFVLDRLSGALGRDPGQSASCMRIPSANEEPGFLPFVLRVLSLVCEHPLVVGADEEDAVEEWVMACIRYALALVASRLPQRRGEERKDGRGRRKEKDGEDGDEDVGSVTSDLAYALIGRLTGWLSLSAFARCVSRLLSGHAASPDLSRLALQILCERLEGEGVAERGGSLGVSRQRKVDLFASEPKALELLVPQLIAMLQRRGGNGMGGVGDGQESDEEGRGDASKRRKRAGRQTRDGKTSLQPSSCHEDDLLVQTVLMALQVLAQRLAPVKAVQTVLVDCVPAVLGVMTSAAGFQVSSSALACLSVLIRSLGLLLVEHVPVLFPHILTSLQHALTWKGGAREGMNESVLGVIAALVALEALLSKLGRFAHPYLPSLLSANTLLHPFLVVTAGEGKEERQEGATRLPTSELLAHSGAVRSALTVHVGPRVMIPAMINALFEPPGQVLSLAPAVVASAFDLVGQMVERMERSDFQAHYEAAFQFLLQGLEYRHMCISASKTPQAAKRQKAEKEGQSGGSREQKSERDVSGDIEQVEDRAVAATTVMVTKLSGALFRPLFAEIVDWATVTPSIEATAVEGMPMARVVSLLRLCNALIGRLKSVFVPFTGSVLELAHSLVEAPWGVMASVVGMTASQLKKEVREGRQEGQRKRRRAEEQCEEVVGVADRTLALRVIQEAVEVLYKVFIHDLDGFVGRERMERIVPPLIKLLQSPSVFSVGNRRRGPALSEYRERVVNGVVTCIGQLAVLSASDVLWKLVNHNILMLARGTRPDVRKNAIAAVLHLYEVLGQEYLVLLPESVSFLAELVEDEDEEVEMAARGLVTEIEGLLGEPLNLRD